MRPNRARGATTTAQDWAASATGHRRGPWPFRRALTQRRWPRWIRSNQARAESQCPSSTMRWSTSRNPCRRNRTSCRRQQATDQNWAPGSRRRGLAALMRLRARLPDPAGQRDEPQPQDQVAPRRRREVSWPPPPCRGCVPHARKQIRKSQTCSGTGTAQVPRSASTLSVSVPETWGVVRRIRRGDQHRACQPKPPRHGCTR
jgi:hypothetical protein